MGTTSFDSHYLFETSWEVCNKIGGIYTVITTKANKIKEKFGDRYFLIGPDIVRDDLELSEFTEDETLYIGWRKQAASEGIRIKIGKWNIPSQPNVILVDYSTYINQKNEIFSKFWESYKLDSLSGQWDYIESSLFGYAAGRVVESFMKYHLSGTDKVIAQFHEWMTGTGILYLEQEVPQVATIFTTHATVLGRCLAGNKRKLYDELDSFNPDEVAQQYNVVSKNSLERNAAENADIFTTVSEITAKECSVLLGREVDVVTPNGFDDSLIPDEHDFHEKRGIARKRLFQTAEALIGHRVSDDALLIATSGRYEFTNKGIDLFISALGQVNKAEKLDRDVIAFFLIPANHYGARKDLLETLKKEESVRDLESQFLTHHLHDADYDPVINGLIKAGISNSSTDRVKAIFIPSYLNGNDGIVNLQYYDLLSGFDYTIFPSYYEPWGYTPLESIAFKVPTVTTGLAGFGQWVKKNINHPGPAISVLERTDDNYQEVADELSRLILSFSKLKGADYYNVREQAFLLSKKALWDNFIEHYYDAFLLSIDEVVTRSGYVEREAEQHKERVYEIQAPKASPTSWKRLIVSSYLPEKLSVFKDLMTNLWWSWDVEATELFKSIDPVLWEDSEQNPLVLFENVDLEILKKLENDEEFLNKLNGIYSRFQEYLGNKNKMGPKIAYFSMEYGLHDSLKIFSGGLGILAGDYLKEASDQNKNMVAIGLLYRYGYFKQLLSVEGEQLVSYEAQQFSKIPVTPVRDENGEQKTISLALPGRILRAKIWKVAVGRIELYLLDTDYEENKEQDRYITHHLYGGDNENRLKQELLLGIGGIRALEVLDIKPDLYHSNEGHSAFISLERLRRYIADEKLTFPEAREIVRSSTLFTTHTPVPAGHDAFDEDLLRAYVGHYPDRLQISWDEFMGLGRTNPYHWDEKFNMSHLANNMSQYVNGVSWLHGKVSRGMFANQWPGYLPDELHIGYVTNGVHYPTWIANEWRELYKTEFGQGFEDNQIDKSYWEKIYNVPDEKVWAVKQQLRTKLIESIKDRYKGSWIKRHENPKYIVDIIENMNDKALTIGFARRFATYKRAHLLFNNYDALKELVTNSKRPVQFIFAGKAHPHDKAGQDLIKMIVDISKEKEFIGKILFLQNYDMTLAKYLVQGVDIWLNTPTRPLEASGTSGEKAVLNGTMHFSVLDGWWVEGYKKDAGWALPLENSYTNPDFQDKLDAETIYSVLENEIIPDFYSRDKNGLPRKWISYIKNTIAKVAPDFTTTRMMNDYYNKYYSNLDTHYKGMVAHDYALAKSISYWKKRIEKRWEGIKVMSIEVLDNIPADAVQMGKEYALKVVLDLNRLKPDEIGVEIVITENFESVIQIEEFKSVGVENNLATYIAKVEPRKAGTFNYGIRVFPKHEKLPHRQDFGYLKWI